MATLHGGNVRQVVGEKILGEKTGCGTGIETKINRNGSLSLSLPSLSPPLSVAARVTIFFLSPIALRYLPLTSPFFVCLFTNVRNGLVCLFMTTFHKQTKKQRFLYMFPGDAITYYVEWKYGERTMTGRINSSYELTINIIKTSCFPLSFQCTAIKIV